MELLVLLLGAGLAISLSGLGDGSDGGKASSGEDIPPEAADTADHDLLDRAVIDPASPADTVDEALAAVVGDVAPMPGDTDDSADMPEDWEDAGHIVLGTGDQASSAFATTNADGAGEVFVIGTWIGDPPATAFDFDPGVDQIHLYYDSRFVTDALPLVTSSVLAGEVISAVDFDGVTRLIVPMGTSGDVVQPDSIKLFDMAPTSL